MSTPLITEQLLRSFPPRIRERGERYFRTGRVRLQRVTPDAVHATVRGSSRYAVSIVRSARSSYVGMMCTCPYAEDQDVCKHLYAVALAVRADRDADRHTGGGRSHGARNAEPAWARRLKKIRKHMADARSSHGAAKRDRPARPLRKPLQYRIQLDQLKVTGSVLVEVRAGDGRTFGNDAWRRSADHADRALARLLLGAEEEDRRRGIFSAHRDPEAKRSFTIPPPLYGTALRGICETGRCRLIHSTRPGTVDEPATWDAGGSWTVRFAVEASAGPDGAGAGWRLRGWLARDRERMPLEDAVLVTANGLALTPGGFARLRGHGTWPLMLALRTEGPIVVPSDGLFDLAAQVALLPRPEVVELPKGAEVEEVRPEPEPRLRVRRPDPHSYSPLLPLKLAFEYDGLRVSSGQKRRPLIDRERRRIVHRDPDRERAARQRLEALGATERTDWRGGGARRRLVIAHKRLDELVSTLVAEGWHVEADGRLYRAATATDARVSSGIDWFDLEGGVSFGEQHTPLPEALAALRRGEGSVTLDDGSVGVLPVEWLRRYAPLADLAAAGGHDGRIRFRRGQAALLDALLAEQPEVRLDRTFARMRERLRGFERVRPAAAPRGFRGELRPYQKEGLGWMSFLRRLELGGCLADDMGLGKTVQVLALLERRRQERGAGLSLVVVPKSLVLNWMNEARRFTPNLRVRNHTGQTRHEEPLDSGTCDVVLTTYGTLRRDAPELAAVEFDYVVLDEAQAIKNAASATAKAARLLTARHRLALSGTPIENHIGELWSLFEFLNPGMLGSAKAFAALRPGTSTGNGTPDEATRAVLARTLRPFLLRRTKEQVAPELPPRTEQTVFVELKGEQKKLYESLRDHYVRDLLGRVEKSGITRSRMHILEALLRLRQAALHPGLLDNKRSRAASAKLPLLLETLQEVVAEGHRALVFSQFTSFLAFVREGLERAGIGYEYLDGRTRDRQARVDRFQRDGDCPVFLISLRAGGHGLNLTAADYVFLLDPWWNPAVEAQAIDRTHRIGQTKPVVAMRLIAKDTVEEKVLELQRSKRELADAVLGEDAGLLSRITREDLELLLM